MNVDIHFCKASSAMKFVKSFILFTVFSILNMILIYTIHEYQVSDKKITYSYSPMQGNNSSVKVGGRICKDVFKIGKTSNNMTEFMELVVSVINKKKVKKLFMPSAFYEVAGYNSPRMIHKVTDGTGLGGSNLSLAQEWRLEQVKGQLAHLSCRLRVYEAGAIRECVGHRPHTRITYIGDSRIRQHVEVMLDLLRPLHPIITTHNGKVITVADFLGDTGQKEWLKYKQNFRIECAGLKVEFRWAPLLHTDRADSGSFQPEFRVGGLRFLEEVASAESAKVPDLLLLDTAAWYLHDFKASTLKQVDMSSVVVMEELKPLLARLTHRTTVVWTLPDPFKDYISHDYGRTSHFTQQTNAVLEWLLNAQLSLQPPGVILWDSFLPVAHASLADCIDMYVGNVSTDHLPPYSSFSPLIAWHCSERMHIGLEALGVAVQMTLNHLCNPYMEGDYCCSR